MQFSRTLLIYLGRNTCLLVSCLVLQVRASAAKRKEALFDALHGGLGVRHAVATASICLAFFWPWPVLTNPFNVLPESI